MRAHGCVTSEQSQCRFEPELLGSSSSAGLSAFLGFDERTTLFAPAVFYLHRVLTDLLSPLCATAFLSDHIKFIF